MEKLIIALSIFSNVIVFLILRRQSHHQDVVAAYKKAPTHTLATRTTWLVTLKKTLTAYIPIRQRILRHVHNSMDQYGADHTTLGIFLCINYLLPYFMWTNEARGCCYAFPISIRCLCMLLCLPLLLKHYWPTRLRKYFPVYWYFTVMCTLPFSTTLGWLMTGGTTTWFVNVALTIIMLGAIVDWLSCVILGILGTGLGIVCYHLLRTPCSEHAAYQLDVIATQHLIYTCIFAISISFFFCRKKKKEVDKRLEALALFGKVVGDEMRNTLARHKAYVNAIQFYKKQMHIAQILPLEDHQACYLVKVDKKAYTALQETIRSLVRDNNQDIQKTSHILDTLCNHIDTSKFTIRSMKACVNKALINYAYTEQKKESILVNLDTDFPFYGSTYYLKMILFHLLENAYKHSQKDFRVKIWLSKRQLHVKDSGSGIAKEVLPYIFDPFFTTTKTSLGIGLPFCRIVMEAFGGIIICKSKQGKQSFTEFVMSFPEPTQMSARAKIKERMVK